MTLILIDVGALERCVRADSNVKTDLKNIEGSWKPPKRGFHHGTL